VPAMHRDFCLFDVDGRCEPVVEGRLSDASAG
jgi:hypothetical protein